MKIRLKNGKSRLSVALRAQRLKQNAYRLSTTPLKSLVKGAADKIPHRKASPQFQAGWSVIGDKRIFARSKWERNFAYYLEWQRNCKTIDSWEHEPKTFWFEGIKRGVVSYLPDFKVNMPDGSHYWVEVKGYMDPKSATKLRRFAKHFPKEELRLIDSKWYKANNKKLSMIIPGWEA